MHSHENGSTPLLTSIQNQRLTWMLAAGAFLTVAGGIMDTERLLAHLLLAGYLWVSLALAGAVFLALHYVTRAGWSVVIKRVPEAMAGTLPQAALFFFVILAASHRTLYPWAAHEPAAGHAFSHGKTLWLSSAFFLLRAAVILGVWIWMSRRMLNISRKQDRYGGGDGNGVNLRHGAQFLVVFALTFSLASWDWIMSLEPHWFSTIYGLYGFSALFLHGLAAITVLTVWLRRKGLFGAAVTENHLHDLGKLMLAFSTFWAYIWLSEYLLIWYANIPEETVHYAHRHAGAWSVVEGVNLAVNWVVPFLLLLPRVTKRHERALRGIALMFLAGAWVDLFMRIVPAVSPESPMILPCHFGPLLVVVPLMLRAVGAQLAGADLLPRRDPLLAESLRFQQ